MTSNLKAFIKFFFYFFIDLFVRPSKKIKQKSLLLIRTDAIGDYILFRNFIKIIKNDKKYQNYSITLVGNIAWKSLAEELDEEYIDNFIWLDCDKFMKDILYRFKKMQELVSYSYEILINPAYSREFFISDNIAKNVYANKKIASIGDYTNIKRWQKNISDKYYDILIPAKNEIIFEFLRNKQFFECLLKNTINLNSPKIEKENKKLKYELPKKYAILFIGASNNRRKWSIENFSKAANYLKKEYNYEIVICGTLADSEQLNHLLGQYEGTILNLVGKTSLLELSIVTTHADLILSNDTMLPHLAVSLMTPNIFVIFNASHYGRFLPYPKEICENHHVIYHPYIDKDLYNYKILSNSYGYVSDLYIDEISFTMVKDKIDSVLKK